MSEPTRYRIYFNKYAENGCIWSVDEGDISSEINVQYLEIRTPCFSGYDCRPEAHLPTTVSGTGLDYSKHPRAWIETFACRHVGSGGAIFYNAGEEHRYHAVAGPSRDKPSHAYLVH